MPVYIDPMQDHKKRIGRAGPLWCHMIADTDDELHAMAQKIGLLRSWFQDGRLRHYDIGTPGIRQKALAAGAIACNRRQFVLHMRRISPKVKV